MYALSQSPCFPSNIMIRGRLFLFCLYSLSNLRLTLRLSNIPYTLTLYMELVMVFIPPFFVQIFFPFTSMNHWQYFLFGSHCLPFVLCELCVVIPDAQNGGLIYLAHHSP